MAATKDRLVWYGARLALLASLSIFDSVTDSLVSKRLIDIGASSWGIATACCVLLGLLIQVLVLYLQSFRRSRWYRIKWMLIALTGLMPVIQAWAVWNGSPHDPDLDTFSPIFLLSLLKGGEVIFEALPNSVFQMIALLTLDRSLISTIQLVGLSTSFLAAGVILTQGNFGIEKSVTASAPRNPC